MPTAGGLKGFLELASDPARSKATLPVLLRFVAGGVVGDGAESTRENFTLSRGFAMQMHFKATAYPRLRQMALVEMARRLWSKRLQVWGDGLHPRRSLASLVWLFGHSMDGADRVWTAKPHEGPLDGCGIESCETLWVRADTGGRDLDASFGPVLDLDFAARVRDEILGAFASAVEEVVQSNAKEEESEDDEDCVTCENAGEVIGELTDSFDLRGPLDLFEAWSRQQVLWVVSHASFRIKLLRAQYPGVTDVTARGDGSLTAISWRILPVPNRQEIIEALWPQKLWDRVASSMPTSLEDSAWEPYLLAWRGEAINRVMRSDPRALGWLKKAVSDAADGIRPVLIVDVDNQVFAPGVAHPNAAKWIEEYAEAADMSIRYHEVEAERATPTLDAKIATSVMEEYVKYLGTITKEELDGAPYFQGHWPSGQEVHLVPKWHDGRLVRFEQALFGDQGMAVLNHVEDWPENLPGTFGDPVRTVGGSIDRASRGPTNLLRRGLGTWINRAISEYGQQLIFRVLTDRSPAVFRSYDSIGPILQSLPSQDAAAIGQLLACDLAKDLWGYEFSWNIAFALGGSNHAAIEVRSALQERLRFTNISADMPGWTLRGPSELSFIQFANELTAGTRQYNGRKVERAMLGAYIWSKEMRVDTGEPVPFGAHLERGETTLDLTIALVGEDRHEGRPTDRHPNKGYTSSFFKDFQWTGLDPDKSILTMIDELSETLERARIGDIEDEHLHKFETHEEDGRESARHDREAFELTMKELAKVLLYMQMREARLEREDKAYGDNVGRGEHPLLPPKNKDPRKAKASALHETVLHRIRVGPIKFDDDEAPPTTDSSAPGQKVTPHTRMGHIRQQAVGPGWRDHKPVWIKPQWIGLKAPAGGPPRLYDVG